MRIARIALVMTLGSCSAALATVALGHHSFAAQYDVNKPITLTGKVTKVEWTNPHVYFHVDVRDETTGDVVNWSLEVGGGPNTLIRRGWTRNSLKPDDVVTVEGSLARDGSHLAHAATVVLASSGQKLFASQNDGQ
jgi:hypothetical protein